MLSIFIFLFLKMIMEVDMTNIGFFIGHKNYIPHAKLLCDSLYKNFAINNGFEIFAMVPDYLNLNLDELNVKQVLFTVPADYLHIPFIDKIFAAAAFEDCCSDKYMWLDVDSYFFKSTDFPAIPDLLINPVDKKNIGDNFNDDQSAFWRIIYDYFDMELDLHSVTTTVTKEKIYPYYNVGMVFVNRKKNLFNITKKAIIELLIQENVKYFLISSSKYSIFFHQAVFSCAIIKLYTHNKICKLPVGLNYPMHLHYDELSPLSLDHLISIRYDMFFEYNQIPSRWEHIFSDLKSQLVNTWYY